MCLSDSLDYVDGQPNQSVKELAARFPVNWISGSDPASDHVSSYFMNPDFSLRQTDKASGQLFHQRRLLDDGQLLFLVNSDLEHTAEAEILIKGRNLAEIDLNDGAVESIAFVKKPGQISCGVSVPPGGSRLFLATMKPVAPRVRNKVAEESGLPVKPQGEIQTRRLAPNVLTIDYLDLEAKSFKKEDMYFMTAMYKLFELSGLETGNPWQHKIQFRQQYLEMDNFTQDSWFKARYHFFIDPETAGEVLEELQAVIERPDRWRVKLNGTVITPVEGTWWLDRYFPVYKIGSLVKSGENIIELSAEKMSVFSELMPVYILGDFSLSAATAGFSIKNPGTLGLGTWKNYFIPFYGDKVSYSRVFTVEDPAGIFRVKADNWKGAVAEVWVNGRNAGKIGWAPYELDITDLIQKGNNLIDLRLTGSLKNTLGYHHVVQTGWIDSPFSWNQGPEKQPSGTDYQFLDYGLFSEFQLINYPKKK
jgi:hypothetical protein